MEISYLLLGSNLGDREGNFRKAISLISKKVGQLEKSSAIYETAAWGKEDQPSFYNQVLKVRTGASPLELLIQILDIEAEVGRVRLEHWGPRIIDIDILFFGNQVIDHQRLTVPHPQLHLRAFTLIPLSELCPDFIHPLLNKSVEELLKICPDPLPVKRLNQSN